MKILVCVKRVPATETRVRIAADGRSLDPAGVKFVMSPYDEFALEAALRTRDDAGEGEVVALTLGDDAAQETLRSALAMGADRAILIRGEIGPDGLATARTLRSEIEDETPDLVLLGLKAVDDDQQQVGPMLATLLGWPCATSVAEFRVEGGSAFCERGVEGGREKVRLPLPAVLTITKGTYEPRYPSLKGIMAANKKPLETRDAQAVSHRIRVEAMELPPEREGGRIVGEGPEAVPELVRLLREEAKVV